MSQCSYPGAMQLDRDGAQLFSAAFSPAEVAAYATPVLHASDRAASPARRRVLQLLYSANDLPGGFDWLGI